MKCSFEQLRSEKGSEKGSEKKWASWALLAMTAWADPLICLPWLTTVKATVGRRRKRSSGSQGLLTALVEHHVSYNLAQETVLLARCAFTLLSKSHSLGK